MAAYYCSASTTTSSTPASPTSTDAPFHATIDKRSSQCNSLPLRRTNSSTYSTAKACCSSTASTAAATKSATTNPSPPSANSPALPALVPLLLGPLHNSSVLRAVLPAPSFLSAHHRATPHPALFHSPGPSSCSSGSPYPLDPSSGPDPPAPVLGLRSGVFDPTSGAVCHPGPLRPHLRPRPAPAVLSAPARRPNSPIRCSPSPGRRFAFEAVFPTLPSASLPHSRPDTHYSLSSTMSLRGSAAASCQPGLPPASRWPLSRWPGPAPLPVRLRCGLLCPRCSRCGRRAGFCHPALASPPPAPLPTPPGAPVPQRRAGAGRLCGNQSVRRSSAR